MSFSKTRRLPRVKAFEDATTPNPKKIEKGEVTQWSATSDDGKLLKMLIENGNITAEITAGQVQKKYKMFNAYAYRTFSSAL